MKKEKRRNPAIVEAEKRGFDRGYAKAFPDAMASVQQAKEQWAIEILDWFDSLGEIPGIGPKRVQQIANHFTNTFKGGLGGNERNRI